jgi:hypothetical protein
MLKIPHATLRPALLASSAGSFSLTISAKSFNFCLSV